MITEDQPDLSRARLWRKSRYFEDFAIGQRYSHHWGRTVTESDNILFTTLSLSFNPCYFNREYALAMGHRDILVNPMLVFGIVLGLSVEDLTENAGAFVGLEALKYHEPVYPGDTLMATSEVIGARASKSRPNQGIVTWHTEGFNQRGRRVIDYCRSNLVFKKVALG